MLRYNPGTDQWVNTGDLLTPRIVHEVSVVNWNVIAPFCIPPGAECWSQSSGEIGQCGTTGTECLPWLPDGGIWDGSSAILQFLLHLLLDFQKNSKVYQSQHFLAKKCILWGGKDPLTSTG